MSVKRDMLMVAQPSLAAGSPGIPARCSEAPERARPRAQQRRHPSGLGEPVTLGGLRPAAPGDGRAPIRAFTLIEMLVVIAVIGIVAAISVPALKNFKRVDADAAATRQLADEMANARQRAISQRSDVYMVFIPPVQSAYETEATYATRLASVSPQERQQATNLLRLQFTGYGFYSERSVGDQPGQSHPRYHGEWRQLPEGTFIALSKFFTDTPDVVLPGGALSPGVKQFWYRPFPFPLATSQTRLLPYVAFDHQGRVFHEDALGNKVYDEDVVIPLARGSVGSPSSRSGPPYTATTEEKPAGSAVNAFTHVRVSWLTGRASIERLQVQ